MTEPMVWFCLVAGFLLAMMIIAGVVDHIGKKTLARTFTELRGVSDDFDQALIEWAKGDLPKYEGGSDGRD